MSHYTPTPEQKQATEQRRSEFRSLAAKVAALPEAERAALAQKCSPVTVEGRALSLTNTMLLIMQHPTVTIVGGFQQWRKAGRTVRKGEHGLMIWIPKVKGKDADAPRSADDELFFFTGTVFDVSQTDPLTQ